MESAVPSQVWKGSMSLATIMAASILIPKDPIKQVELPQMVGTFNGDLGDKNAKQNTTVLLDKDVLLGRSSFALKHPGNEYFRTLIRKYRDEYKSSKERKFKIMIIEKIMFKIIAERGGRFLKNSDDNNETKKNDNGNNNTCVNKDPNSAELQQQEGENRIFDISNKTNDSRGSKSSCRKRRRRRRRSDDEINYGKWCLLSHKEAYTKVAHALRMSKPSKYSIITPNISMP